MVGNNRTEAPQKGTYFSHIDGLRAFAILPVVFYHVMAKLCPGGFAGVDVFFVISGYLIVGGVLRDLDNMRFTLSGFYYRRIRRIIPAYTVMIAIVFCVGSIIYYSWPLRDLGEASLMGSLFSANLYYWRISGDYFASDIQSNPLLHIWSLSVEEQFYMVIPLLCMAVWRIRRQLVTPVIAVLAVVSLIGAITAVKSGNQNTAFYLLHLRGWELLVGALLNTIRPASQQVVKTGEGKMHILLCLSGILLIVMPYALMSSATPFPGISVIPSVLGTAILIRYSNTGLTSKLLSWNPLVYIGKISYSLYLWHWPVIVFWKYITYNQLFFWDYIGMFIVSLLLAYLSWRYVETPVRVSTFWTKPRVFSTAAAVISLLVVVSTSCVVSKGWPTILHTKANASVTFLNMHEPGRIESFICRPGRFSWLKIKAFSERKNEVAAWNFSGGFNFGEYNLGNTSEPDILLLGDSHSAVLRYGLDKVMSASGHSGYAISILGMGLFDLNDPDCRKVMDKLSGEFHSVKKVVIAEYWPKLFESGDAYIKLEAFARVIAHMHRKLYIVTNVPVYANSPADIAARLSLIPPRKLNAEFLGYKYANQYNMDQQAINIKLKQISLRTGAVIIPIHMAFKANDRYICRESKGGLFTPLYMDTNHLSPYGSNRAAKLIMRYLFPVGDTKLHDRTAHNSQANTLRY